MAENLMNIQKEKLERDVQASEEKNRKLEVEKEKLTFQKKNAETEKCDDPQRLLFLKHEMQKEL